MRKKKRWKSAARPRVRFTYRGVADGKIEFFRFDVKFTWGPVACDRVAARGLVDFLNRLHGRHIKKIGNPVCDAFIKKIRDAEKTAGRNPGSKGTNDDTKNNNEKTAGTENADR